MDAERRLRGFHIDLTQHFPRVNRLANQVLHRSFRPYPLSILRLLDFATANHLWSILGDSHRVTGKSRTVETTDDNSLIYFSFTIPL